MPWLRANTLNERFLGQEGGVRSQWVQVRCVNVDVWEEEEARIKTAEEACQKEKGGWPLDLTPWQAASQVLCVGEREKHEVTENGGSAYFYTLKLIKWCNPPQRADLQSVYNVESPSCINRTWTLNSICNIDCWLPAEWKHTAGFGWGECEVLVFLKECVCVCVYACVCVHMQANLPLNWNAHKQLPTCNTHKANQPRKSAKFQTTIMAIIGVFMWLAGAFIEHVVRACFYSEVFVVFLYVGPCPLCVSLSLRLRKLENNKCFHMHTGRWNALLVNIKLPLRVGKREGDGDGSYFFFPATRLLQRGREIEKQDVDEENDIKWQRFEETDYRFTLARGGGGRGGKKYIFLSTGVPPRANKRPRKVNNTYFMPSTCVCVNVT